MVFGAQKLFGNWQVGDGREEALARYVRRTPSGDLDDAIRGDRRVLLPPELHDERRRREGRDPRGRSARAKPRRLLELGAYCGYSALRRPASCPRRHGSSRSSSTRPTPRSPAGSSSTPASAIGSTVVVGTLGDGGEDDRAPRSEHGFAPGSVDFVFVDHDKDAYLPDLERILERGLAAPRLGRGRRQRQAPRRAQVPRLHAGAGRPRPGGRSSTRPTSSTSP